MVVSREVGIAIASITGKTEIIKIIEEEKGEVINICTSIEKCMNERVIKTKISTRVKLLTIKLDIIPNEIIIKKKTTKQNKKN